VKREAPEPVYLCILSQIKNILDGNDRMGITVYMPAWLCKDRAVEPRLAESFNAHDTVAPRLTGPRGISGPHRQRKEVGVVHRRLESSAMGQGSTEAPQ